MTKGIHDFFDLPEMDKAFGPGDVDPVAEALVSSLDAGAMTDKLAGMDGRDHGEAMDKVFDETLKHAQSIMDLGFNIDHARAARMFEVGATMYKVAVDAKNSKRDAQIKTMELILKQQKHELEKRIAGEASPETMDAAVVVEDRNELIKRLREQAKAEK